MKKNAPVATSKTGGRSLLMSGLIVAAITGVAPAWAVEKDNMSITDNDALARVTTLHGNAGIIGGNLTAPTNAPAGPLSLKIENAGLHVTGTYGVSGANGQGTGHVTAGRQGKIYVGQAVDGTKSAATLTADNMTINGDGAEVLVTGCSTLSVNNPNFDSVINIVNGALTLNEGTVVAKTAVNIEAKGTLQATGSLKNLVQTPFVNLNGGTIHVAKDAAMTLDKVGGSVDPANLGDSGSQYGTLHVKDTTLVSKGGTIRAKVHQKGTSPSSSFIAYQSGVTTIDNMSIENGTSTIAAGATLNITQDKPLITGSTSVLDMQGGTLTIAGGNGTLHVQEQGTLMASAGNNTVQGGVNLTDTVNTGLGEGGILQVGDHRTPTAAPNATLTITKDLTVGNGVVNVGIENGTSLSGGKYELAVQGNVVATDGNGQINIGTEGKLAAKASDFITKDTTGIFTKATDMKAQTANSGVLYLTGYSGTYELKDVKPGGNASKLFGLSGVVALIGGTLTGSNEVNGTDTIVAPDQKLVLTGTTISATIEAGNLTVTGPITIANGGTLGVNGSGPGTSLVTDANGKPVNITVDGTLQFGNELLTIPQGGTAADIAITGTGNMGVTTGNYAANKLTMDSGSALNVVGNGSLTLTTMTTTGATINVGNEQSKGTLVAGNVSLGGSTVILDPAWGSNTDVSQASQGKLNFTNNTVDGIILVGQQSLLTLQNTDTTRPERLADTIRYIGGWGPQGTTAAMGVYTPITLDSAQGSIVVNGAPTGASPTSAGNINLAANSLLVANLDQVDYTGLGTPGLANALITSGTTGTGTVTIADGQSDNTRLYVENLKKGEYKLFAGFNNVTGHFTEIVNNDLMLNPTYVPGGNTGDGTLSVARNQATDVFPGMSGELGNVVNQVWDNRKNDVNARNAGVRFVSRAANTDYVGGGTEGARAIEGAARLAVVGAAPGVTLDASRAATTAATARTSFASPLLTNGGTAVAMVKEDGSEQWKAETGVSAGDGVKNGTALWIMPLYQNTSVWGMKADDDFKTGYNSNLGGIALGGDYTFNDAFRLGLALNIGAGYAQSSGDFSSTDNTFNFWGINAYGGWTQNNFGITADVGYTSVFNDIEQDMISGIGMGNIKADVNSSIWTAGLRAEYKIQTSVMDVIPHISARYTGLRIDSYDAESNGGTLFETEESYQSIWTFPVGVTLTKEVETGNGWKFKPQVDLSIVPAAGDVKAHSKVKIPGMGTTADLSTQVVDYVTFDGGLGFEVQKDNVSFGLNYNIQASEHRTGHGVFGTFRYEF